ncbi:hypothetical protein Bbelb_005980 [Branchiostoma belcheri]|nr:hypothetical protein Bbelb_005980 [Branchiostoma belcheri]
MVTRLSQERFKSGKDEEDLRCHTAKKEDKTFGGCVLQPGIFSKGQAPGQLPQNFSIGLHLYSLRGKKLSPSLKVPACPGPPDTSQHHLHVLAIFNQAGEVATDSSRDKKRLRRCVEKTAQKSTPEVEKMVGAVMQDEESQLHREEAPLMRHRFGKVGGKKHCEQEILTKAYGMT